MTEIKQETCLFSKTFRSNLFAFELGSAARFLRILSWKVKRECFSNFSIAVFDLPRIATCAFPSLLRERDDSILFSQIFVDKRTETIELSVLSPFTPNLS